MALHRPPVGLPVGYQTRHAKRVTESGRDFAVCASVGLGSGHTCTQKATESPWRNKKDSGVRWEGVGGLKRSQRAILELLALGHFVQAKKSPHKAGKRTVLFYSGSSMSHTLCKYIFA